MGGQPTPDSARPPPNVSVYRANARLNGLPAIFGQAGGEPRVLQRLHGFTQRLNIVLAVILAVVDVPLRPIAPPEVLEPGRRQLRPAICPGRARSCEPRWAGRHWQCERGFEGLRAPQSFCAKQCQPRSVPKPIYETHLVPCGQVALFQAS